MAVGDLSYQHMVEDTAHVTPVRPGYCKERARRIELPLSGWKPEVLPLNYARDLSDRSGEYYHRIGPSDKGIFGPSIEGSPVPSRTCGLNSRKSGGRPGQVDRCGC